MPRDFPPDPDIDKEIARLARHYKRAGGPGLKVLNMVGGRAEDLLRSLPEGIGSRIDDLVVSSLEIAMLAAERSRGLVKDQPTWLNLTANTGMGALGGFGGLPTALAELPVTTTLLLRNIQGVAASEGFDPAEKNVQFDSLQVFGAGGPLGHNEGAETAFFTSRVTLTGATVHGLISKVAPRFAAAFGQKLAAQSVPVMGAAAGAATNLAYSHYYTQMARVHFGLRRLAIETDHPEAELVEQLRAEVTKKRIRGS